MQNQPCRSAPRSRSGPRLRVLSAVLVLGAVCALSPARAAGDTAAADAAKLVTAIRKPDVTPEQRQQIADQLLALGDEGARQLARYAGNDVEPRLNYYLSLVERAANNVLRDRVKANGGTLKVHQEATALRQKSLAVSRSGSVSKDDIQKVCDPAIARLTELLLVTPEQASAAQPDLADKRAAVLQIAALYHAAVEKLAEDRRKGLPALPPVGEIEQVIAAREEVACLAAMPMKPQDKGVLTGNLRQASKLDPAEVVGINELNRIRLLLGLNAQAVDLRLCAAARDHSKDMREHNFFAHASPVQGKETPWKRAALAGTKASSENIYQGREDGKEPIKAWWYSPGHHVNMMKDATRVGLGRDEKYWTQLFGN